jgi:hypothetical protein
MKNYYHKLIYLLFMIFCLYYWIVGLYIVGVEIEKPLIYDEIMKNWKLSPLVSVREISYANDCADDEEAVF